MFRFLDEPIFNSLYWPEYSHHVIYPKRNNLWSTSIPITGYQPNEIAIKEEKTEEGEVKIIVHAKHVNEEDFAEFKKCIKIPKNVDHENLRSTMTKEGLLVLKAPYKISEDSVVKPIKINREDTWSGIWGELGRLNDQMNHMIDFGGALSHQPRVEFVPDENKESGTWRMTINVGKDFKSDDIKLRHQNKEIYLEAKKETKTDNSSSSRYIKEVLSLPEGIEEDKLNSKLLDNGQLVIEAPCNKMPSIGHDDKGKVIPVESGDATKMAVDN